MLGKIFLVSYIIAQTLISIITEYVVNHHNQLKNIGKKTRPLRIFIYVILAVIPMLGAYLPNSDFKFICMKIGNIWFAFFMFYAAMVLFATIVLKIITKAGKIDPKLIGHALHFSCLIALIVSVYGLVHAQNTKLVTYDLNIDRECSVDSFKVVLLADLHLSVNSNVQMTENMVQMVNEQKPDLIVIAGDIFTSNIDGLKDPEKYSAALSKLEAKYGVYAVAGNHDVDENLFGGFCISPVTEAFRPQSMEDFFKASGFNMLYDESVVIADAFTLAGRIDGERAGDGTDNRMDAATLLASVDKTMPVIVLQHEPRDYEELSKAGADAVLSGHTHDGQIFPGNFIVPLFNENAYGVKELYGMQTVVTAGVGYYGPPIRVGTDSEVTVINISFGK